MKLPNRDKFTNKEWDASRHMHQCPSCRMTYFCHCNRKGEFEAECAECGQHANEVANAHGLEDMKYDERGAMSLI